MSRHLSACAAILLFTLSPNLGVASEASATSERLIGWSKDGKTWAVISSGESPEDGEHILVYREGKVVVTLCDPQFCELDEKTKPLMMEPERVGVRSNEHLKQFDLDPVNRNWRKAFKSAYKLAAAGYIKDWNSKRCPSQWTIAGRDGGKVVGSNKIKKGCLRAKGGYLHPNGKFALIKQEHSTWSKGDELWTHDAISYVAIELGTPTAAAPK